MSIITKETGQKIIDNIRVENDFNKTDGSLPYSYFHPELEGKLIWVCNYDAAGKITSVFQHTEEGKQDRQCDYLENIEKAKYVRNELISHGWQKLKPPKITFSQSGDEKEHLNRKERRSIQRHLKNKNKKNPFN